MAAVDEIAAQGTTALLPHTPRPAGKERPILFSAPMVQALLAGRKTQTRRIVKPQPTDYLSAVRSVAPQALRGDPPKHPAPYLDRYNRGDHWCWWDEYDRQGPDWIRCPYGVPGDQLYVREAFSGPYYCRGEPPRDWGHDAEIWYWADGNPEHGDWSKPKPGIHMPRWASRLTLTITEVRVERLQDISEADAKAEGIRRIGEEYPCFPEGWSEGPNFWTVDVPGASLSAPTAAGAYAMLWQFINGPASWEANPWVWAVSFSVDDQSGRLATDAAPVAVTDPGRDPQ